MALAAAQFKHRYQAAPVNTLDPFCRHCFNQARHFDNEERRLLPYIFTLFVSVSLVSLSVSISVSLSLSVCLSACLCLSLSLSVSLSLSLSLEGRGVGDGGVVEAYNELDDMSRSRNRDTGVSANCQRQPRHKTCLHCEAAIAERIQVPC